MIKNGKVQRTNKLLIGAIKEIWEKFLISKGQIKIWAEIVMEIIEKNAFKKMLSWNFLENNFKKNLLSNGKNKIIPRTDKKESWKPKSSLNNLGLKMSMKVAAKIKILKKFFDLPEFKAKRAIIPIILARIALAGIAINIK